VLGIIRSKKPETVLLKESFWMEAATDGIIVHHLFLSGRGHREEADVHLRHLMEQKDLGVKEVCHVARNIEATSLG